MPVPRSRRIGYRPAASSLLLAVLTLLGLLTGSGVYGLGPAPPAASALGITHRSGGLSNELSPGDARPLSTVGPALSVSVAPATICSANWTSCPAGTSSARVTVQVSGPPAAVSANYSSVQVLFLLETTPYDGAYDANAGDSGYDPCASGGRATLCEESSLLRTFASNAGGIAAGIARAHPGTEVTFGLVDYFATLNSFDDGDGAVYHVDVGNFTASGQFPSAVNNSLFNGSYPVLQRPGMIYGDSDLSDSFLTVPSISTLYLALFGSHLNWSADAHHVLVQLGSGAPQDPHYPENYCVSASDYRTFGFGCYGQTCEPSVTDGTLTSPACVGWVVPPANNTNASIAQYARTSPSCAGSAGSQCTIDVINVWDTPTDPNSLGWPSGTGAGGGPGGTNVTADSADVLQAGCDIAQATGGSWDGPAFYACNATTSGTLHYSNLSYNDSSLLASFDNISFGGPGPGLLSAAASAPLLTVVMAPGVVTAPDPNFSATCSGPYLPTVCPQSPAVTAAGSLFVLSWNWSSDPGSNRLVTGDSWTLAFDVQAAAGSEGLTPIYLCRPFECLAAGAGPVGGLTSVLSGILSQGSDAGPWTADLPLVEVTVESPTLPSLTLASSSRLGEAPFLVSFAPAVSGGVAPETVFVDFGDGYSSSVVGPVQHTYSVGSFLASAHVTDGRGQMARASVPVDVLAPLQSWISEDTGVGTSPLPVTFSGNVHAGDPPYSYVWSSSDGWSSPGASPEHTFATAGTWTVSLTVTDALGYLQSSSAIILVEPPQSTAPIGTPPGPGTHLPTSGSNSTGGSLPIVTIAAVVLVAAAVGAAGLVLYLRRLRR